MFPDKIKITDELIKLIIDTRKEYNLTAYQLSEKIGKNKSWLPNIENKRTKNILKEDLILLFKDFARNKGMDSEDFIIKYISPTANIELDNNVTVPNHYLQHRMGLFSPDHEDLHISTEERNKRIAFHYSEKPYEIDLATLEKKLKNLCNLIIDEFSYYETSDEREKMIKMVEIMWGNFLGEFSYTKKLYQTPLFYYDVRFFGEKTSKQFLYEIDKIYESFFSSYMLAYAKADLYQEFEIKPNVQNLFTSIENITETSDSELLNDILFEIECLLNKLHDYILAAKKESIVNQHECTIDFSPAFKNIIVAIRSFVQNAHLKYHFEYDIPVATNTLDEIEKRCLEINSVIFGIKQQLRAKK